MQKLAVVLSCGIFSALLCVPSFAVSDSDPLVSSYEIQDDVSVLSVPPVDTLATRSTSNQLKLTMPNGDWFVYYQMTGMDDVNLQGAFNANIIETRNFLYSYGQDIESLKASVSSGLNQAQLESSLGNFWSIFDVPYLYQDGTIKQTTNATTLTPNDWLRVGLMGLAKKIQLGFPDGSSFFSGTLGPIYAGKGYSYSFVSSGSQEYRNMNFYEAFSRLLYSQSHALVNNSFLRSDGTTVVSSLESNILDRFVASSAGLAAILRGSSGASVSGSLLNYSDLSSNSYSSNNILGAFKPLFYVQNDLARLTHVIADPTEQALHDATKDNVQSVTDNLTGDKGVTSQDIGDLSGISSGVGDFMTTGVSVDRLSGSISDEGNYSFFSQQTADDLHTFPAPQSADVDFVDFYALNRQKYSSLLGGDSDG